MTPSSLDILGVSVYALTAREAVAALDDWTEGNRVKLAYLNAHGSNLAARDAAFRRALQDFIVLNDGIGVDLAAKWLHGRRFPENLNGTDFTVRYLQDTRKVWRVYLLGAKPGIAAAAAGKLSELAPRHAYVGARDGYFQSSESANVAKAISESGADLVLVALGNPGQELWIAEHLDATGSKLAVGVGALFDFLSGSVPRAPEWVRAMRAEWVYRLALEPRRLARRYLLGNPLFLARTLRRKLGL
jgi:exopolysaccharide biosynthesis WecB/TagA/CpsF family protein